jgi:hypothetical protein
LACPRSPPLLAGYGIRATLTAFAADSGCSDPHLPRGSGGFFTPSGWAASRSCLAVYQIGLGFSPIQSGLLVLPQAMPRSSGKPHAGDPARLLK